MQFQLGQRIKGQMVCLSIHPDCWIEIEIRLYASKVQNKLYNPSFYQSRKNKVCYFLHLSIQGLLKLHYGKGLNSIRLKCWSKKELVGNGSRERKSKSYVWSSMHNVPWTLGEESLFVADPKNDDGWWALEKISYPIPPSLLEKI